MKTLVCSSLPFFFLSAWCMVVSDDLLCVDCRWLPLFDTPPPLFALSSSLFRLPLPLPPLLLEGGRWSETRLAAAWCRE